VGAAAITATQTWYCQPAFSECGRGYQQNNQGASAPFFGVNMEKNRMGAKAQHFERLISQWHHDRNLIEGSTDKDQFCKLVQEVGELSDHICKGQDIADDIGDIIVVLINIATRNNLDLEQCIAKAWDDIKDRKGQMVDGVFVKAEDYQTNTKWSDFDDRS
jgi:hypothetical protein